MAPFEPPQLLNFDLMWFQIWLLTSLQIQTWLIKIIQIHADPDLLQEITYNKLSNL
jgi:hypothetical protein